MVRGCVPRVFRFRAPVWQADIDAFGELRSATMLRFLQETALGHQRLLAQRRFRGGLHSGHRFDFEPWKHPAIVLSGTAFMFALVRFASLPSRVHMALRMAPFLAVTFLPPVFIERMTGDGEARAAALDECQPIESAVDRIAARGPKACGSTLKRMAGPTATTARKQALHRTLVRLKGSDLGETYEAWLPWCREAYRRP